VLPPAPACPPADAAYFYADRDARTRATSEGLVDGFFAGRGCGAQSHALDAASDPLFHPVSAGVCALDREAVRRDLLAAAGGDRVGPARRVAPLLAELQGVTGCCQPVACDGAAPCTLAAIPARIVEPEEKTGVTLGGAVAVASNLVESFQMQWAEGMPAGACPPGPGARCVGWGAVDEARIQALMPLHTLKYELCERTPTLARAHGSNLAWHLARTLEQAAARAPVVGAIGPPGARFVAVVGHDGNLVALAGMLGLHWKLPGFVDDDLPATSALVLELRRVRATRRPFVRASIVSQSLAQMREDQPLSLENAPVHAAVTVPGCPAADCPLEALIGIIDAVVQPACTRVDLGLGDAVPRQQ
jgi:4-phytase/acid phosphatase